MSAWIEKARKGDFDAIPENLTYDEGGEDLAMLIDGFEVAGSAGKCAEVAWPVLAQIRAKGSSSAPALAQWMALHYQARCYRHSGRAPNGPALAEMDALTWSLRGTLGNLTPKAKAGLLSIIEPVEARP